MADLESGKPHAPLAVTMGEPAGIAAEITVKAWRHYRENQNVPPLRFFVIACEWPLRQAFKDLGIAEAIKIINAPAEASEVFAEHLPLLPLSQATEPCGNIPHPANAPSVLEAIDKAARFCRDKQASAMVTNPIHKAVLMKSGFAFTGHTDYLAHLCEVPQSQVVMMLANSYLRTVPITVHQALRSVPQSLNADRIKQTALILWRALQEDFAMRAPRIKVAGLNPHAGEDGALGDEENAFINRAIADLQAQGLDIQGTFAADSLFAASMRDSYDAALCMYHDQALIPIKTLDFDNSVNISLGLPIIRTSPDHGSACDIKGKNIASAASLIAALRTAHEMAHSHA